MSVGKMREEHDEVLAELRRRADAEAVDLLPTLTSDEITWILAFYRPGAPRHWASCEGMPNSMVEKGLVMADWRPWGTYLGAAVFRLLTKEKEP